MSNFTDYTISFSGGGVCLRVLHNSTGEEVAKILRDAADSVDSMVRSAREFEAKKEPCMTCHGRGGWEGGMHGEEWHDCPDCDGPVRSTEPEPKKTRTAVDEIEAIKDRHAEKFLKSLGK